MTGTAPAATPTPIPTIPNTGAASPPDGMARARPGRSIRGLIATGFVLAVAILALTVYVILEMRAREISDAEHTLTQLDLVLAEQTDRTIQAVDLLLQGVVDQFHTQGAETEAAYRARAEGPDTFLDLKSRVTGVPQLDAVTLISGNGDLMNFSRYYPIPHVNVADRDYFKALQAATGRDIFLSEPVENRGTGTTNVYLARRFSAPNGEFLGLVLGAMQVSYFQRVYDELRISPGTAIALRRADGLMLASRSGSAAAAAPPAPEGASLLGAAGPKRVAVVVASRSLQDYPITIEVSQTLDEVLAEWRHDATAIAIGGVVAAAAVALLIWALARQLLAYDAMAGALAARATAERGRRDAEEQLRQAQKMEAVGQLTAGLAHDFNNLLMSIMGCLDGMGSQTGEIARRIGIIRQAAERGGLLTRQLLAFSRKQILTPRRLDLNAVLRDTSELLQGTLGGTMRVVLRLAPDLWEAFVDSGQLEHAVLNLVINARDAMPGGGFVTIATENVTLAAAECPEEMVPGDYVRIRVIDAGSGMPPEIQARAFDPFFTTKAHGSGSGLGLSQAYGFARQSGGGIRIESQAGSGTTVSLWLPRASGIEDAAASNAAAAPTAAPEDYVPADAVVLLVDDDAAVRETVAAILIQAGFQVLEAPDGPSAILRLDAAGRVDLLVADYGMPGMNGVELARHVRKRHPGMPVIFITGYADAGPLSGERYLLQKPFRGPELIAMANTALWHATHT